MHIHYILTAVDCQYIKYLGFKVIFMQNAVAKNFVL